jgi:hypothetical protein
MTMVDPGRTGKSLIESDRVDGTEVYGAEGEHIGEIKRMMIDKVTGKVAYCVMSFGGFLGLGEKEHMLPWQTLTYDADLGGFRTGITEKQLSAAPDVRRSADAWTDREDERKLHDYWKVPPYWG